MNRARIRDLWDGESPVTAEDLYAVMKTKRPRSDWSYMTFEVYRKWTLTFLAGELDASTWPTLLTKLPLAAVSAFETFFSVWAPKNPELAEAFSAAITKEHLVRLLSSGDERVRLLAMTFAANQAQTLTIKGARHATR